MKATTSILALVITLGLSSCKKEKGTSIEPDSQRDEKVVDLEEEVGDLRKQLVDEQNLRLRQDSEQAAVLADMRNLLKEIAETRKAPAPVKVVPLARIEAEKEAMDPNAEARRVSRLKAQGEKLAKLVTKSGAQYEDLVITRVTDLGVVFRHKGGIARVPFSDLEASWQKRFYHDHDRVLVALKKERLAQANYDRTVAANVRAMEKEGAGDGLNLGDLAQAIANIDQPRPANTTIIEETIHVDPPIILNNNHRYHNGYYDRNGVYCPPVVRTPVIRTRPDSIPVVRPVKPRVKPTPKPTVRPTPRPTVRPTPRPTVHRPATPRPSTTRPATQRPRPTSRPTTPSRPQARPAPKPRSSPQPRPSTVRPSVRTNR